jgi:hypothetical protein
MFHATGSQKLFFYRYTLKVFGLFYRPSKDLRSSLALLETVATNLSVNERRPR